jgi:undecaprenyl-diphosphatase
MDGQILLLIQEHLRVAWLNGAMIFVSRLGNAGIFWIVLGLVLSIIPKTRKYGVLALASLLVCFLFNNILLKNLVARARPYTQLATLQMLMPCPSDYSFPSGHACSSFAVSGALMWSMDRKWNALRIPCLVLAIWIAFSRLYVGVHYPTDVLTGTLIGLVGSFLVCRYAAQPYDRLAQRLRRG